jgi:ankyrin repeat protein
MLLIDGGADLSITGGSGWTPLHVACQSVNHEIIRVLILNGADTQARDIQGYLPVEYLGAEDRESRAMYEEAMEEVEYGDLRPVLK